MTAKHRPSPVPLPPPEFTILAESVAGGEEAEYRVLSEREDAARRATAGLTFRDDFVLAAADDADGADNQDANITLRPPDGLSPAERRALTVDSIAVTADDPQRSRLQFSMVELFWLMTFFSAGFAVLHYFPLAESAGVLGLLALIGQGLIMRFPPENRHIRLAGYALLMMYGLAAFATMIQGLCWPT
jgi:hypothetical protein